ncbi:hypothetical protein VTO42DRAFT_5395 [Malbranchea cinnamomea]
MDVCTLDTCPIEASIYKYRPALGANITFLAVFAVSGLVHTAQLVLWRNYAFASLVVVGCVTEVIGYVGRVWLYYNPFSFDAFLMQICCLTIAPAFYSAAIYLCIGYLVRTFGLDASRLRPSGYACIFIPCDIISLILQAVGGALASAAVTGTADPKPGTNVMVAGLAFQVFSLLVFITLVVDFALRVRRRRSQLEKPSLPVTRQRLMLFAVPFSVAVLFIFIRCVFRVAELSEGWTGHLITEEPTFIALECVMIAIAVLALHIGHPGLLQI